MTSLTRPAPRLSAFFPGAALALGLGLLASHSLAAFIPTGDVDADGKVDGTDVAVLVTYLNGSGPTPPGFADVNGDARVDGADVFALIDSVYAGGFPPKEPAVFLDHATFGATDALVTHVRTVGFGAYLDEQFAAPVSGYPVLPLQPSTPPPGCDATCLRDSYSMYPLQTAFYRNAFYADDQLRQRMVWALHKILVVSGRDLGQPSRMGAYLAVLEKDAFGTFRQLLYDLTLNPGMGSYLDMITSTRTNPNENYAREVLQLFSVGLELLNPDGTPQLDGNGVPIPTYDQSVVTGFSKVFTGWTFAAQPTPGILNYVDPMVSAANNHDTGTKQLLSGVVLPAGQTAAKDLGDALDNIANHPNVGPFLGKLLIHDLVTSNPSPAYVARVAAVFANNGAGVRGDLAAVLRAILLDPEAAGGGANLSYGRLKEPVLFITTLLRALGVRSANGATTSDGYLNPRSQPMGVDVFQPPSVFSYYPADYEVPASSLLGPEFGVLSASTSLSRDNFVNTMTFSTIPVSANAPNGTSIDLAPLQALAGNPAALVDELNRRLMHGTMSSAMSSRIVTAVNAVSAANTLLRAQQALYLVATSSQLQVER